MVAIVLLFYIYSDLSQNICACKIITGTDLEGALTLCSSPSTQSRHLQILTIGGGHLFTGGAVEVSGAETGTVAVASRVQEAAILTRDTSTMLCIIDKHHTQDMYTVCI